MTTRRSVLLVLLGLSTLGCDLSAPPARDGGMALPPGEGCNSVRLTSYEVFAGGWCEVPRDLPVLPAFVREEGLTAAMAEPFAGGYYGGELGEACGECWEIDTLTATRTVMVMDLCPNEGNPLCQGGHFHIDLASEAASILMAGGLDEARARRVPCPVEGSVQVYVNDENYSYLRLAFVNARVPVRRAWVRSTAPGSPEIALRRSGGAWEAADDTPLDRGGEGVTFIVESVQGERLESSVVIPAHPSIPSTFDLGVQFEDRDPPVGGACEFVPPGVVFDDEFGGIDEVRWAINPWGEAESGFFGPVTDGCYAGACLRVERLGTYSGFHLYYRTRFPTSTFGRLRLRLRANVAGELNVAPSDDGARCTETTVSVGTEWSEVEIDVAEACAGMDRINEVTVDNGGPTMDLRLDDVRFE